MKKIVLSLSLVLFICTSVNAQWTLINSGTTAKLDAIHFFLTRKMGFVQEDLLTF